MITLTRTRSTTVSRTRSLARAEGLQFLRNRTLVFMATVMPTAFPLAVYFILRGPVGEADAAANAVEIFTLFSLTLVQFYSVLSMATTRRDEKVLKRLRSGEPRDGEILTAIGLPGAVVTLGLSVLFVAVLLVAGAPVPGNPLLMVVALVLGLIISTALALVVSGMTQNAEAAQITSLPVIILAMISLSSTRAMLPESFGRILDLTPFAVISDLVQVGWIGSTPVGDPSSDMWRLFLILVLWTMVTVMAAHRYMRWDTHR